MHNPPTIALVGSDSLLGREFRDIAATSDPPLPLTLIAAGSERAGSLTRQGDEPAIVNELTAHSFDDARVVILAGPPESSRKALEIAGDTPDFAIVDLTYAAEDRPDARLRAPLVESPAEGEGGGEEEESEVESEDESDPAAVSVIAHPAAIALALFLRRLHTHDAIRRSVIQVFAPASEHGQAGVEELQHQTVSLLAFKSLPKSVFDAQLSFALLAQYGAEAPASLETTELMIERHLASLLNLPGDGEGAPMPSLRLIQAPVFHGYSFSAWVEFENSPGVEALENGLAFGSIDVRGADFEPPNNVGQAGQGGISVGGIAPDRNEPEAVWFWLTADNVRLVAENAVAAARELA